MSLHKDPDGTKKRSALADREAEMLTGQQLAGDLGHVGLTRLHGPIRVKRSGSVKGVEDGQDRQALLA